MKNGKKKSGKRAVKDLSAKKASAVKGGVAATGQHIKKLSYDLK